MLAMHGILMVDFDARLYTWRNMKDPKPYKPRIALIREIVDRKVHNVSVAPSNEKKFEMLTRLKLVTGGSAKEPVINKEYLKSVIGVIEKIATCVDKSESGVGENLAMTAQGAIAIID